MESGKEERKLSAIMFADIFGYSMMMGQNEGAAFVLINDYKSISEPIVNKFNLYHIYPWLYCLTIPTTLDLRGLALHGLFATEERGPVLTPRYYLVNTAG